MGDASNCEQCGRITSHYRWVLAFYTVAFVTLALAWWFL